MAGGMFRRAEQAFTKQCVLFIRQSTMIQKVYNLGSADVQFQQRRHLERMDVAESQIITIDARGESGRAEVQRHHYQEFVRLLESGTVGVLVLARFDRVGRNREDSNRVLRLLEKCGGVLLIDGKLFDPRLPQDGFSLDLQSSYAEYENRARMLWLMVGRLSMARRLRTAVPLPTGLTWFPVRDVAAVARLRNAGLGEWLDRLPEHRAVVGREVSPRYVLPYPDRDVFDAARLRIEWLLETQDLAEVRARMRDPRSGWPHPGRVPIVRSSVYGPEKPVLWLPMECSNTPAWFVSPSLYSIYSYTGRAVADHDEVPVEENTVWEPNAFPSFAEPSDLARVKAILNRGVTKPWKRRVPHAEHLLPNVRCARKREDGRTCGRRMSLQGSGSEARYATSCSHPRPMGTASRRIEGPVLAIITQAWQPDAVRAALQTLRLDRDAVLVRRTELKRHFDSLQAQARAARNLAIDARAAEDPLGASAFMDRQRELEAEARVAMRELQGLEAEEGEIREATQADFARILQLAADLPKLLRAASTQPEIVRRLVGELTESVHVCPLAYGIVEVEVEFPSGARRRMIVETHPTHSTQPERVYAAGRLAAGGAPEEVAAELTAALAIVRQRAPSIRTFRPRQVGALAVAHREGDDEPARKGVGLSPREVAEHFGVSEVEAMGAMLMARLGPAGWSEAGTLTVVPTDEEAGLAFPSWARVQVAQATGWPVDDIVRVGAAARELGISRYEVESRADNRSGRVTGSRRRTWVRRSEVADPDATLRDRMLRLRPDLDPRWWERLNGAAKRLGISRFVLANQCETQSIRWLRQLAIYVWIGPGVAEALRVRNLEDEVARVAPGADPAEFVPLAVLVQDLARRTGVHLEWRLRRAVAEGVIASVEAGWGRGHLVRTYVRVPPQVLTTHDEQVIHAWLAEARKRATPARSR